MRLLFLLSFQCWQGFTLRSSIFRLLLLTTFLLHLLYLQSIKQNIITYFRKSIFCFMRKSTERGKLFNWIFTATSNSILPSIIFNFTWIVLFFISSIFFEWQAHLWEKINMTKQSYLMWIWSRGRNLKNWYVNLKIKVFSLQLHLICHFRRTKNFCYFWGIFNDGKIVWSQRSVLDSGHIASNWLFYLIKQENPRWEGRR